MPFLNPPDRSLKANRADTAGAEKPREACQEGTWPGAGRFAGSVPLRRALQETGRPQPRRGWLTASLTGTNRDPPRCPGEEAKRGRFCLSEVTVEDLMNQL